MKNAGKACNNRLYRHIRTFEKIVKNYFVILITYRPFLVNIYLRLPVRTIFMVKLRWFPWVETLKQ